MSSSIASASGLTMSAEMFGFVWFLFGFCVYSVGFGF